MARLIISNAWMEQLCESQGIRYDRTTRIIIDAQAGSPILMYITQFGDSDLLELTPPEIVPPDVVEASA